MYTQTTLRELPYQTQVCHYAANEDKGCVRHVFVDEERQKSYALQSRVMTQGTNKSRPERRQISVTQKMDTLLREVVLLRY